MRQKHLIVLRRDGSHHQPKHHEKRSHGNEGPHVALVKDWAGKDAHDEEEEALRGTDPGYCRGGVVGEEGFLVVALEDAKGINRAPTGLLAIHSVQEVFL